MIDTIFALATAPGRAAVAVIRISGPGTAQALCRHIGQLPKPRRASVRQMRGRDGEVLDRGLALWFPGPASYTGEDCAELHLHGGAAVVAGVSEALLATGLRLAAPGEFTRRAFENGKLDLDQAEAIADLIDAESRAQARQAAEQLEGALGARYRAWRGDLIGVLAHLEAALDFPDEGLPADVAARARAPLAALLCQIDAALGDRARGRRIREGYRIAIIGAPNAGKSSLLNLLAGRDAAIVAPVAGTTRDVIEIPMTFAGYRTVLADMAGVRAEAAGIEGEGVRRARSWSASADLRLWVIDQAASEGWWREPARLAQARDICVINKMDLPTGADAAGARAAAAELGAQMIEVSLVVGGGITELSTVLAARVADDLAGTDFPAVTRARHEIHLREAQAHLRRAIQHANEAELAAEDARLVARALSQITGEIGTEDILERVFASFCIGK
jgi:tRNA modification GTPase